MSKKYLRKLLHIRRIVLEVDLLKLKRILSKIDIKYHNRNIKLRNKLVSIIKVNKELVIIKNKNSLFHMLVYSIIPIKKTASFILFITFFLWILRIGSYIMVLLDICMQILANNGKQTEDLFYLCLSITCSIE